MSHPGLPAAFMLLWLAACATGSGGSGGTRDRDDSEPLVINPTTTISARAEPPPKTGWTGSFQPMQQRVGGLGPTGQNKAFGTVTLTSEGTGRMAVSISLSTPLSGSTSLAWAVLPGRCGSASLPVIGIERFPAIDVSNNGRGQITTEMSLDLAARDSYHVNVYWSAGVQLSDVMTCANLRKFP